MQKIIKYIQDNPNVKIAGVALIVSFLVLVALGLFLLSRINNNDQEEVPTEPEIPMAEVYKISISQIDNNPKIDIEESTINMTETLRTSSADYMFVWLANEASFMLAPNTVVELNKIPLNEQEGVELTQSRGEMWHRIDYFADEQQYIVNTPLAKAEVFGTRFSSEVFANSTFTAIEHTILVSSLDESRQERVNEGNTATVSRNNITIAKTDYDNLDNPKWFEFNNCIDSYMTGLINQSDVNPLTIKDGIKSCSNNILETKPDDNDLDLEFKSLSLEFVNDSELRCDWEVSGLETQGFAFWIGTEAGSSNIQAETFTQANSARVKFTPVLNETYFCTVRAITPNGNLEETSDPITFIPVSGSFTLQNPSQPDFLFNDRISGSVEIANINLEQVTLRYSIKRSSGQYFNSFGQWVSSQVWLPLPLTIINGRISFDKQQDSDEFFENAEMVIELIQTSTTDQLDNQTVKLKWFDS